MRNVVLMVVVLAIGCQAGNVKLSEEDGKVRVTIDGQLFTEYNYREGFRPYCYPIIGPLGTAMTRDWPMRDNDYDKKDHPHHKGLWFAHGTVNGINFWGIRDNCGKTIHDKTLEMTSGESRAVLRTSNKWVAPDGREILRDERTLVFHADSAARMIDFSIKLIASAGEVNFADTKEGTMALRVATAMNADGKGNGKIINSEGLQDGATWGKRARWVDYCGVIDGKSVGMAIIDHPKNLRYPTWWHVRTYGLFAANPFGIHDFEKKPPATGDFILAPGESTTLRYRFVFHVGNTEEAKIEERAKEFQRD